MRPATKHRLPRTALADLGPALRVMGGRAADDLRLLPDGDGGAWPVLERYAIVPSLTNPRVLLPLDATGPALRTALARHGAGASSALVRCAARALRAASGIGLAPLLLRNRIAIVSTRQDLRRTRLRGLLADLLGRNDFATSMRLAPRRPNGKPVVQVVAGDGSVLAYAKFGWDELTRRLVRHEAEVLGELCRLTPGTLLRVPSVLYSGAWEGLEALVLVSIEGRPLRPRAPLDLPIAASVAVAGIRGLVRQPLAESRFWRELVAQVALTAPQLGEQDRGVVQRACATVAARWGRLTLPFGQSHGDWIPPNMSISADGIVNAWDWERSSRDVPVGVDAMQFVLHLALHRRWPSRTPVGRLVADGGAALARHGLEPRTVGLLLALSLLRSILWYGEARHAGRREQGERRYIRVLADLVDTFGAGAPALA